MTEHYRKSGDAPHRIQILDSSRCCRRVRRAQATGLRQCERVRSDLVVIPRLSVAGRPVKLLVLWLLCI